MIIGVIINSFFLHVLTMTWSVNYNCMAICYNKPYATVADVTITTKNNNINSQNNPIDIQ